MRKELETITTEAQRVVNLLGIDFDASGEGGKPYRFDVVLKNFSSRCNVGWARVYARGDRVYMERWDRGSPEYSGDTESVPTSVEVGAFIGEGEEVEIKIEMPTGVWSLKGFEALVMTERRNTGRINPWAIFSARIRLASWEPVIPE